jgi:PAS domain S-box-containing protein
MNRPKLSVAGIVIAALVTTTTLLLAVLGYAGYDTFSRRQYEQFDREQAVLADQLAVSLALPLWNFDRAQIGKVLESAMQDEDVYRVEVRPRGAVTRADARTRDANGKIVTTGAGPVPADLRLDRRDITSGGEIVGEVRLSSTARVLQARLDRAAVAIVAVIALLDAVLVVAVYLLLWCTVLRPLKDLERHALAVSSEHEVAAMLPPRRYCGELSSLRTSLEKMIDMLRARYAAARASEALERRLADELRESEAKFSKVFRASPISIALAELDPPQIVDANEAFLRVFQCTREQVIGHSAIELGLWNDPADRERIIAGLHRGETVRDLRIKARSATGAAMIMLISCELIELSGRSLILAMVRDITARERTEEALRESEEKFSTAFRSGPDAMAIAEFDTGRYFDVNEGFERLLGYKREEVIGRTAVELGFWPAAADREAFIAQVRKHGAVREQEVQSVNRRGEAITYLVSAEGITLGGRRCIVTVTHDITDRKRAEADRARAIAREVEAREEFTRQLLATQEAERRRIAGELHDSLGQNLLLVKNRAQLALNSGAVAPELRWQFESIHDMAVQAIAEVRQISHDLRPYQLDQLGLTRALEGMIDGAARNTGFPFTRKLDPVDDVFPGEAATHLFRIVQECVNNILKHARAQSAQILVERDIHHVRLWVEDDGGGFAPETLAHGFGLKNIAERARIVGGALRVGSVPGRGTRLELIVKLPESAI